MVTPRGAITLEQADTDLAQCVDIVALEVLPNGDMFGWVEPHGRGWIAYSGNITAPPCHQSKSLRVGERRRWEVKIRQRRRGMRPDGRVELRPRLRKLGLGTCDGIQHEAISTLHGAKASTSRSTVLHDRRTTIWSNTHYPISTSF